MKEKQWASNSYEISKYHVTAVFPLSWKKTALSAPFLEASRQKFWKSALAFFGHNFIHWRELHKTQFKYFFKDVQDLFSRLKPFSGQSMWKVQTHFGNSPLARFIKKFWAHFPDFCVSKESCLPWSSDAFFELSASKVYKNVLGAFSWLLRAKTKLLAMKSRCILEVFTVQVKKRFWVHFLDFSVQKRRYFTCSSDAFWKLSACKFYRKSPWRNFMSYASKSKAVCRWVQMHSGCSLLARFIVKSCGCNFTIYVSNNKAVCCWFQTHFRSFRLASLIKMFWAHFLNFCVQKRRCLLWSSDAFWKFSACKVYRKKFLVQCHDMCVQKRSSFLRSSDASWKFSPCKVYRKSSGRIFPIFASKSEVVCCELHTHFWRFRLACFI